MMKQLKTLWHQLMGDAADLAAEHTAIVLHWPSATGIGQLIDKTFMLPGILNGPALDGILDALIEEHVPATDGTAEVITEISLFWHHADGAWDMEEILSHYYTPSAPDCST